MLISEALEGKYYKSRSRNVEGIIQHAQKRENVWTGENEYAYTVQVRPVYNPDKVTTWSEDFYATVYVGVDQ